MSRDQFISSTIVLNLVGTIISLILKSYPNLTISVGYIEQDLV